MGFSKILSAFSFVGALVIGIALGSLVNFSGGSKEIIQAVDTSVESAYAPAPIILGDLRGVWKGTWGYNRANCTIQIDNFTVDENEELKFYGTLKKGDAEIDLVGTIDTDRRTIAFQEIRVVRYGEYQRWSLGKNVGSFSSDGLTMAGTGTDEWGTYGWDVSKRF
jgi:hypothetical protein